MYIEKKLFERHIVEWRLTWESMYMHRVESVKINKAGKTEKCNRACQKKLIVYRQIAWWYVSVGTDVFCSSAHVISVLKQRVMVIKIVYIRKAIQKLKRARKIKDVISYSVSNVAKRWYTQRAFQMSYLLYCCCEHTENSDIQRPELKSFQLLAQLLFHWVSKW